MPYDPDNIFAKILRSEIPCKKIFEDDYAFAFHDINPQAPIHVLVIPKGEYENHAAFAAEASAEEIAGFTRAVGEVVEMLGVVKKGGYRLISNCGKNGGQEVPHYHVHILGGAPLGRMVNER